MSNKYKSYNNGRMRKNKHHILAVIGLISLIFTMTACGKVGEKNEQITTNTMSTELTKKDDRFYGKIFTMGDSSVLYLNADGTYSWYKDDSIKTDNYFEGTFVVDAGRVAEDKLVNELSSYGITKDELASYYVRNLGSQYNKANLICLVMTCKKRIVNNVDETKENDQIPYYGFCTADKYDIANMMTGNYLRIKNVKNQ